ncbi:hypothetical protein [Gracilimonas sp.]|uniref:hypothetical protein n=1 Tax=Gracilimonas sp. TaxID=1974203 RepID=UPI003D10102B
MLKLTAQQGLILLIAFLLSGCGLFENEQGLGISWQKEDLNDYVVYTYNRGFENLGQVDPVTGEVLHVFTEIDSIITVVPSPSGNKLFVSTSSDRLWTNPGAVYEVDTRSWEYRKVYDQAAYLKRTHDDELYFITSPDETGLNRAFGKIEPTTGEFEVLDSLDVSFRRYDHRSIAIDRTRSLVYYLDENDKLNKRDWVNGDHEIMYPDTTFWWQAELHVSYSGNYLFMPAGPVIDLRTREIIGSLPTNNFGIIASRKDEKEVYITDPGRLFHPLDDVTGIITVYSPKKNRVVNSFKLTQKETKLPYRTFTIDLTEKERYAVIGSRGAGFLVVDLKTRLLINVIKPFNDISNIPRYTVLAKRP